jgi:hypothetical protein
MEKKILQATEYLLLALNQIKNFQDFINYKQELIKAINDIKDSVQIKNNGSDSNENKIISKISSNLGLKYDYNSIMPNTEERDGAKTDHNELKDIMKSYSKINNMAFYSINPNENENEEIIPNSETILYNPDKVLNCTESLRSKLSRIKYDKLYATKKIRNRFRNKNRIKKYFEEIRQKEKIDTIAEIIMKINKEKYIHDILIKLFGNNISDKLLYNRVSDEFINEVQNAIIEIEQLKKERNRNNENEKETENIIEKANTIQKKKYQIPILKRSNTKKDLNINCYKSYDKKVMNLKPKRFQSNKFKYSEPYQEFNFKDSLRNKSPNGKNSNNSINNESDITRKLRSSKNLMNSSIGISNNQKPFINATCGYGKYFDEPLQKGGVSKLE